MKGPNTIAFQSLARLNAAYDKGEMASLLQGSEFVGMLAEALTERIQKLSAAVQGMEAEMRRARDMLPPDWEMQRFKKYVSEFEALVSNEGQGQATCG